MATPDFTNYFTTMATVGATLFGLIFVAISIAPERIAVTNAPLERQVKAFAAYNALLNPLIISLFALVPHQQIGFVIAPLGLIGIVQTLIMTLTLVQNFEGSIGKLRNSLFILGGFFLYGYETYFGVRLIQSPSDGFALYVFANLLIIIAIYGVIRAWELIGLRQFHVKDWFSSFQGTKNKEDIPSPNSTQVGGNLQKEEGGKFRENRGSQ
jgi:hypothetical protein